MIPKPLAVFIVCTVTAVWIGNFVAQFLVASYQVDGWVHTIFLSVVGGALVASRKGGGGGPSDEGAAPATGELDPANPPTAEPAPPVPAPPETPRRRGSHRAGLALPVRSVIA